MFKSCLLASSSDLYFFSPAFTSRQVTHRTSSLLLKITDLTQNRQKAVPFFPSTAYRSRLKSHNFKYSQLIHSARWQTGKPQSQGDLKRKKRKPYLNKSDDDNFCRRGWQVEPEGEGKGSPATERCGNVSHGWILSRGVLGKMQQMSWSEQKSWFLNNTHTKTNKQKNTTRN